MGKISTTSYPRVTGQIGEPQALKAKRAAIYVRVSSEEQAKEGYSPQTQEEKIKEFIKANGYRLNDKHIYIDLGHSGGTDKRPALQRFLKDAREKEFDIVIVYRQDRFFRKLILLLNTVNELRELGIEFKSLTEPFDSSTPTGRAMFANAGVFAEWQREIGLEARNEGALRAVKEGKWIGSGICPYGYRLDQKTKKLKINESEAKIIRMIFDWLVNDKLSIYKIQKRLNQKKIPTKYDLVRKQKRSKSKGWWHYTTIKRIIINQIYTGDFIWRKYYKASLGRSEKNLRPKNEQIPMKLPAIVSKKTFEKAQEQLKNNRGFSSGNTRRIYVFQNKLVCEFDGKKYITRHNRPRKPEWDEVKYYMCPNRARNLSPVQCASHYLSESRILTSVWKNLKALLSQPEETFKKFEKYSNKKGKKADIQGKLTDIAKDLISLRNREERLAEMRSKGIIEIEIYEKQWKECKKEEARSLEERERLSQLLLTEEEKKKKIDSAKALYERFKGNLDDASYELKYQVIQWLVNKIIIKGSDLEIEYNLPFRESILNNSFNRELKTHAFKFIPVHNERIQ